MYRIDVFHPAGDSQPPSPPPMYVSLATAIAPDSEDATGGHLVTVGRRNASVLLDKDKSVSRQHLQLHLLSNRSEHQQGLEGNDDNAGDSAVLAQAAGVPKTQEEKNACNENPSGMALFIKCLGKFGSAVVPMAPKSNDGDTNNATANSSNRNGNGNDSDSATNAGGSDTEDESQQILGATLGEIPDFPGMKIFEITKKLVAKLSPTHTLLPPQKIMGNETAVVPGNATTIFLQCGQMGSLLVLTRMDLKICKSGWSKAQEKMWKSQLYAIGATLIEEDVEATLLQGNPKTAHKLLGLKEEIPPTTYMIVDKRDAVVKQLIAWSKNIPIASLQFLSALLERQMPSEPWPKVSEFPPQPMKTPGEIEENFWTKDFPNKSRLWESCTLITTSEKAKDGEWIVRSSGGNVLPVYGLKDKEAQQEIQKLLDDPVKKGGLFAISASRNKKIAKWIDSKGIPHLKAKDLVMALCQQQLLKGGDGNYIGTATELSKESKTGQEDENAADKTKPDEKSINTTANDKNSEGVLDKDNSEKNLRNSKYKRKHDETKIDANYASKEAVDKVQSQTKRSGTSLGDGNGNCGKHEKSSAQKSQIQVQASPPEPGVDVLPSVEEEESYVNDTVASENMNFEEKSRNKKRQRKDPERPTTMTKQPELEGMGTAHLETTKDGWLVAAPKSVAKRQAYLKPRHKILEDFDGADAPPLAETVVCSGLIARPYDPNRNASIATIGAKKRDGKDFKKFRKNSIIKGSVQVMLKPIVPKETQRQKELAEQQRAMDESAKLADDLFNLEGGKSDKRRLV